MSKEALDIPDFLRNPENLKREKNMSEENPLSYEELSIRQIMENCPTCKRIREEPELCAPTHFGSKNCESGSIRSGGEVAHCTCDICF